MSYRQRRLYKMWAANPSCHWCGQITRLVRRPNGTIPDDAGTEDHIYSRLEWQREFDDSVVLACAACNRERGRVVEKAMVEARRKAGDYETRRRNSDPLVTLGELDKQSALAKLQREMKRGYNRELRVAIYEVAEQGA